MEPRAGELVGGRYRLSRLLGAGGFGQVWAADDTVLGVTVALKEVRLTAATPEERRDLRARAAREARHAARLRNHPHIVTIYDVVDVDGIPWIVMQLVEGRSLAQELREGGPLDVERTLTVARALLSAVEAAHAEGITHRDIKPANVLLTDRGEVLLTDFGIAVNSTDSPLTPTNLVIGTPGYTAPERWQGAPASGPSDLYSLGVTLYEAVEGDLPFPRSNPVAALTDTPRDPCRASPRLARLLTALLSRDPAGRPDPEQAMALLDQTAPTLSEEPSERQSVTGARAGGVREPHPDLKEKPDEVTLIGDMKSVLGSAIFTYALIGAVMAFFAYAFCAWIAPEMRLEPGRNFLWFGAGGGLVGAIMAYARFKDLEPDRVTINHSGFSVTMGRKKQTYTIAWESLERIGLAPHDPKKLDVKIMVWYRPGHEPSKDWISKNDFIKNKSGGYRVYPGLDFSGEVDLARWREPLRTYAGPIHRDSEPRLNLPQ
ncbi:serine/threonine-protein kinase [Kitasatospora cineracea]|uniref:serine/threonine-protein kinase n=1 Tax=Kitasatospora cineracea TaxID=88074 RepID=UPI0036DD5E04